MADLTDDLLIRRHESVRLVVYDDATGKPIVPGSVVIGNPTIGIGRALNTNPLSTAEVTALYQAPLEAARTTARTLFGTSPGLTEARLAAFVDMAFNLGSVGLSAFVHMRSCAEAGDWDGVADAAMQSKWFTQTGLRGTEDVALLRSGDWSAIPS